MAFASDTVWDDFPRGNLELPSIRTSWLVSAAAVLGLGVALAGWSLATVAAVHKMETSLSSTPTLLPESTFAPGAVALFDPAHRIEHVGDKLRQTFARHGAPASHAGPAARVRIASAAAGGKSGRVTAAARAGQPEFSVPLSARFGEKAAKIGPDAHRRGSDFIRSRLAAAASVKSARVAFAGAGALSATRSDRVAALPEQVAVVPGQPSDSRFAHEVAKAIPTLLAKAPSADRFGPRDNDAEKPSRVALAVIDAELKDAVGLSSPPLPAAPPARNTPLPSDDAADDLRTRDDDNFSENFPDSVPVPPRRPEWEQPVRREAQPAARPTEAEPAARPTPPERVRTSRGVLAYASPNDDADDDKGGLTGLGKLFERKPRLPGLGSGVAVYDIRNAVVYMPNGEKLEAHSGLGPMTDKPKYVDEKNRGPTPPNTYKLVLRERRFHGVEAIRLLPVDGNNKYGRVGLLAHTYMLRGGLAQSNGCVVFKDYKRFLNAFKKGKVTRLVVVPDLSHASPAMLASAARGA
ncbi:MAG: DUF2778 domain-containing protein [Rhizobiaceae bacterium]|jgi:hypothetical protein